MSGDAEIRKRYQDALDSFLEKIKADTYIIAAVLIGSLSHNVVWERSDIDMILVSEDIKGAGNRPLESKGVCLVEDSINIHAVVVPRNQFRKMIEGSLQSSFMHSTLMKGQLLFNRDDTFQDFYENRSHLGARDREIQLLSSGAQVLPSLVKAEKWLKVKGDLDYSFFWIMKTIDSLASIETLLHHEITGREVIHQALRHNPAFFNAIYVELIRGEKDHATLNRCLEQIQQYLQERIPALFKPLLDFLAEAKGPRSATEINHYFANQMNIECLDSVCEWLADFDIIQKVSTPVRLTPKSKVSVEEAAYYYEAEQ